MDANQLTMESNISKEYLSDQCFFQREPQLWFALVTIILIVIGLLGNMIVLVTILVLKEYKKSVTNWYILQLTIADTLFLLMLPFTAHSNLIGIWNFSLDLCKIKEAMLFINYYSSIYFLVIMSFDRYLAVTKAFDSNSWVKNLRSPVFSYVITIVGWVLSLIFCIQLFQYSVINTCGICAYSFPKDRIEIIPGKSSVESNSFHEYYEVDYSELDDLQNLLDIYGENQTDQMDFLGKIQQIIDDSNGLEQKNNDFPICKIPQNTIFVVWLLGNFFGAFLLPLFLISFFYGMILRTLFCTSRSSTSSGQKSYRRRITVIVLALVSLFVVSWLPWYVEKLAKLNGFYLSPHSCRNLTNAVRILAYLNSALNPYVYSFLGTHFRERIRKVGTQFGLTAVKSKRPSISSQKKRNSSVSGSIVNSKASGSNLKKYTSGKANNINCDVSVVQTTVPIHTEKAIH